MGHLSMAGRRPAGSAPRLARGVPLAMPALLTLLMPGVASGADPAPYASMAPLAAYSMQRADEVSLARSAAPEAISKDAEVLALGPDGYVSVAKGSNGFACLVERSWNADFSDAEFWNPRVRAPICYNPVAARSVLPLYLERTRMALRKVPREEIAKAAEARRARPTPQGAMSYMTSKAAFLGDRAGHAHPHLMFYLDRFDPAAWGANLPGSPVAGFAGDASYPTVMFVPVERWSDGSSAMTGM